LRQYVFWLSAEDAEKVKVFIEDLEKKGDGPKAIRLRINPCIVTTRYLVYFNSTEILQRTFINKSQQYPNFTTYQSTMSLDNVADQ